MYAGTPGCFLKVGEVVVRRLHSLGYVMKGGGHLRQSQPSSPQHTGRTEKRLQRAAYLTALQERAVQETLCPNGHQGQQNLSQGRWLMTWTECCTDIGATVLVGLPGTVQ